MSTTLRLREVSLVPGGTVSTSAFLGHWNIEINNGSTSARMELSDPSSTLSSQGLTGLGPEETIAWYLEDYRKKPFETTQRDTAAGLLTSYGRHLASQIAAGDLVPKHGHLQLQIVTPQRTEKSSEALGPSLQHLHWEVLEDVSVWPSGFAFSKVSIVRSLERDGRQICNPPLVYPLRNAHLARYPLVRLDKLTGDTAKLEPTSVADTMPSSTNRTFWILLVICRPNPERGVDYQLVAKSLVSIVDHISRTRQGEGMTTLHILRPPTWEAFKKHLEHAPHCYDLVHFDTKGKILNDGSPQLQFCIPYPSPFNPLRMKEDWIQAGEVCEVLVQARVRTVVLNACDSASFRASAPGSNLAELLLSKGIQSVLAMAYKVNEEAVEIFMDVFYRSLLVDRVPVEEATYHARLALLHNRSRRAPFMLRVELADHIIPVLYSSNLSYNNSAVAEPEPKEGILAAAGRMAASAKAKAVSLVRWATGTDLPPALLGRDCNLLLLETHLYIFHKVLLHGQGGVGKTELLRYACRFWKSTGWIKGAAYIDFDQQRPCPHKSMAAIARSIASQLRFGSGESSVEAVLEKLRAGKYLVVFDSAEVLDADDSITHDSIRSNYSKDLESCLPDFIDEATKFKDGSIVIIASRLDTTPIARVSSHHKYLLSGLSVLSSVRLLQELTFKPGQEIPRALERRENIDMLRRAVILVEGNPVALRLLVPELRLANFDCEALFANLLYGVCTTLQWPRLSGGSRFERSLSLAYKLEPDFISKLAPFWNIMPKDLTMYHCFWDWFGKFDPEPDIWLSEDFWRQLSSEFRPMSWQWRDVERRDVERRDVERRLIQVGILGHATVSKTNGDMACYHVHPVFTLRSRVWLSEEQWRRARFAFVRAVRLWYSHDKSRPYPDWTYVKWDSPDHQHEDHLHNWRVMALAWCVKDGNALAESLCNRQPLFDYIYQLGNGIIPVTPRYSRLLVPHLRTYLSELYVMVENLLSSQVPTDYVVSAFLRFSYDLWKIESDVLNLPYAARAVTIDTALAVLNRWKVNSFKQGSSLPPGAELSYQQLLYAAAITAQEGGDIELAKALYEAHLATNPAATVTAHTAELQLILWWQFSSLQGWAACVNIIAMRSGAYERLMREGFRELVDFLGLPTGKVKPGQFVERLSGKLGETTGEEFALFAKMTFRDLLAFPVQQEPDAVRRFGDVARALLDEPVWKFFGEWMQVQEAGTGGEVFAALQGVTGPGSNASASGQITEELGMKGMAKLLTEAQKKGKKSQKDAPKPWTGQQASYMAQCDAMMRMLGGDTAGAEAVMQTELAKEALSSTTSTGAEQLANLYMIMYRSAVKDAVEPDYKKGLTFLIEFRRHRAMEQLAPRDQCIILIEFATCYHGLGRVEDAARAAIDLVQVAKSLTPADCPQGDLEAAYSWIYNSLLNFEKLWTFLNPRVVSSGSACALGLTSIERVRMYQIMTEAIRRGMERYNGSPCFEQIKEVEDLLVERI